MTTRRFTGAAFAALLTLASPLSAAPAASPGYAILPPTFTHTNADRIVSFDWAAGGDLFYETATPFFEFGGFYKSGGPALLNGSAAPFAGASVVTIGDCVYFNAGTFTTSPIYKCGPLSGSPAVSQISTTSNYALFGNGGSLFITGFGASSNEIFRSGLAANGSLLNDPAVSIGVTPGNSGPLAFDAAGDLFYAQGFGGHEIYRWNAAEVADAIADPVTKKLSDAGHLWLDYTPLYAAPNGATSMAVGPGGDLLVTLTDFGNPSLLASFGIAPDGSYGGATQTLVSDTGLLGEVRVHDGGLYIASDNAIYQIVPEPATGALLGIALAAFAFRRR